MAVQQLLDGNQQVNGQAFFITDGRPVECWQWISRIIETAGLEAPNKSISFSAAYRIGATLEAIYKLMLRRSEPPMTRFVAAQLALDHYFSIEKAKRLLNYQPNVDVDAEFDRLQRLASIHFNPPRFYFQQSRISNIPQTVKRLS